MKRLDGMRSFEVIASQSSDRSSHRLQVSAVVIAATAGDALHVFEREFPAATVHNLNVKGPELILIDDEGEGD